MKSLRSLIDWLPYYFRANDTYIKDGKGLFERYLEIFGNYFEDKVVGDINTLDDILDVDNTPEVYLGYLWEFLGSMPYANPHAIAPERWKILFNGFDSPTTIEALKKYWIYPMNVSANGTADHFDLTDVQVRALVKYSVALYSIRGTKKFFEVLLKLYGIEATISTSKAYPKVTVEDDDDSDYYGTDQDYYGTDDDYFGSTDSLFDSLSEVTKLDSEWMNLDEDTIDKHQNCTHFVSVNFLLNLVNYAYSNGSNEFLRLQNRMFNLINMFLPLGARPHLMWKGLSGVSGYVEPKVNRSIEVYVDHTPIDWTVSDTVFVESVTYPGWYRVYDRSDAHGVPARYFDTRADFRIMVKVVDAYTHTSLMGKEPEFVKDQPKKFKVDFMGSGTWSDKEYEDGHIFTIKAGSSTQPIYPKFKVSVVDEDDFDLTNGGLNTFILAGWKKKFNYNIFSWYNPSQSLELDNTNNYIPILIQSASVKTYTNDANPEDDDFTPEQVSLDGEDLVLVESTTKLPDRSGTLVDYSAYADLCIYVIHLFEVGTYKFYQKNSPDKVLTIEVTRDNETLTASLVEGLANNMVDNDTPTCKVRIQAISNLPTLKKINTRPLYVNDNGGNIWSTIIAGATGNSPADAVGNSQNKPYYKLYSANIYGCNSTNRYLPINIALAYLTNPVRKDSQYLKITITEHPNVDHTNWYKKKTVYFYPVTGNIIAEEEDYTQDIDNEDIYEYKYGKEVLGSGSSPIINQFFISNPYNNKALGSGGSEIEGTGTSIRYIGLLTGLAAITDDPTNVSNTLYIDYNGLYDDEVLIKEISNPVSQSWNNGEEIILDDPGHYRFYGTSQVFDNVSSNKVDINVESNKYNEKYFLEVFDSNKSDDETYMLRTKIPVPDGTAVGTACNWSFDFMITLDKSIVEATDILTIDPGAFDFEVLLYRGATPNTGTLINSYTASTLVDTDSEGNTLPNYKVKGTIPLKWKYGNYVLNYSGAAADQNYPPGLYCVELHARNKVWPNSPTYKVIDAYNIPQKFDGNLYFDVDVISKAWTSPAGQIYDVDPITGKLTWGWYKTNDVYKYSVRLAQYNPAVDVPSFRLKLTNNEIGYTRIYMYKLVKDGSSWDQNPNNSYPQVLPPVIDNADHTGATNPHWLSEAVPSEWGFPGAYDGSAHGWVYDPSDYTGRWLFTGTVYTLGELTQGPQEPGQYLFMINQLNVDKKTINYAYLSVKEDIDYSLIVDPMLAILQGTAVGTTVTAVTSAKFTKENLCVTVSNNQGVEIIGSHYELPYAFYAYQPGTYTFRLYKFESGAYIPITNKAGVQISANFKVLTSNGILDEYLNWAWSEVSEKVVRVVTTSEDVEWTVKVQTE